MGTRATSIFKYLNVAKQMHLLHDHYCYQILTAFNKSEVLYWFCRKSPNNIIFVCKSLDTDYLLKELCIDNSLCNPLYLTTHTYVPLEFQTKIKNRIFYHSSGYLNSTGVLSSISVILLGMQNAQKNYLKIYSISR